MNGCGAGIDTVYHRNEHSSLQTTSLLRWQRDIKQPASSLDCYERYGLEPATEKAVVSLAQLLTEQPDAPPPGWIEPGLLRKAFCSWAASPRWAEPGAGCRQEPRRLHGSRRPFCAGLPVQTPQAVCFPSGDDEPRNGPRRRSQSAVGLSSAAGHLLSAPRGWNHFLSAAREAAAEVIVLDPLYSTHDQADTAVRAKLGLREEALGTIRRALEVCLNHPFVLYHTSTLHAILGDKNEAVEILKQAVDHRWIGIHYVYFDQRPGGELFNLRNDPQFQAVQEATQ